MSESTLQCEFCNKKVSNAYILKNHQKNTKACLEIQEKQKNENGVEKVIEKVEEKKTKEKKKVEKVTEKVVKKVNEPVIVEKVNEPVVEKVNEPVIVEKVEQVVKKVNVVEIKLAENDVDQLKLYYNMFVTLKTCYEEQIDVLKNTNSILQKQLDEANVKVKEMDNKTADFIAKSSSFNKQIVNLTYDHIEKFCEKDDKISTQEKEIEKLKKENATYAESLKYFYKKYDDAPPIKEYNSSSSNSIIKPSNNNTKSTFSNSFGSNSFDSNKGYNTNVYNTSNNIIPELKLTNEFGEPLDQESISLNTKLFVESMQRMAENVKKAVHNSNSSYEIGPDGSHIYTINNYYNDEDEDEDDDDFN